MGKVSLWLTQKLNASMEKQEETNPSLEIVKMITTVNADKLEGNSSSNCDFSYLKDKAFFLMFEDNGSHCKNIIGGIVEEFSGVCGGIFGKSLGGEVRPGPHTLVLFKTNIADFPTLFETEFRFFIPCLMKAFVV